MKKIYILLLIVLIVGTSAIAQSSFSPLNLNDETQKKLIESSTLIIEGKIIESKGPLFDNNQGRGYYYSLFVIKPTSVLKGSADSTKTYQFLIKQGEFSYGYNTDTKQYDNCDGCFILDKANSWNIPEYGIFFFYENLATNTNTFRLLLPSNKLTSFDIYSFTPSALMVGFKNCINYNKKCPQEKTLKYFQDKFNLKAIPLK